MAAQHKYILLADDDLEDQEILTEAILTRDPSTVINTVTNGQEAVRYVLNCSPDKLPDLIILDYKMPILTAAQVLENIGHGSAFAAIPKVVWSTSNQRVHINECIEKGALEYFIKPMELKEMENLVARLFEILDIEAPTGR